MSYGAALTILHKAILTDKPQVAEIMVRPKPRLSTLDQVKIYTDGYRMRFTQAVRADYPTLCYYWGEKISNEWIGRYIAATPSKHFNFDRYPFKLAQYLESQMPLEEVEDEMAQALDLFAVELARLESSIAEVFMKPESEPLPPETLATQPPSEMGKMILLPRTASTLLSFTYPVNKYLKDFREEKEPGKPLAEPSYLCVCRNNNEVQRHPLEEAEYALLWLLFGGKPLGEVLDALLVSHPEYEDAVSERLQDWFTKWLAEGFFKKVA